MRNCYKNQSGNFLLMVCFIAFLAGCAGHSETHHSSDVMDEYVYKSGTATMANVDKALAQAKAEKRLTMIVLGAQWCHDSVGLSTKFSTDAMQSILKEKYVTAFMDIGYLEDRRDNSQRFGYPGVFGTPTVLIVEPQSETLLNYDTVSKWQAAYSVPLEDYLTYFDSVQDLSEREYGAKNHTAAHEKVAKFEQQQVERLYKAYAVLGPLLKADEDGTLEFKDAFYDKWNQVYQFRTKLQQDLIVLRSELDTRKSDLDKSRLVLPTYPPFEWELVIQ